MNVELNTLTQWIDDYSRLAAAYCTHRAALICDDGAYEIFLVTGDHRGNPPRYQYCSVMRLYDCGEDAVFFEAKSAIA